MTRPALLFLLLVAPLFAAETPAPAGAWLTDLPAALAQAKEQHRLVLVHFSGSDWNQFSRQLQAEVFSRKPFLAFAQQRLVLVTIDFPREKPLPQEIAVKNAALVTRYGVTLYPTVLLLTADGAELGRTAYLQGGPKTFVRELQRLAAQPAGPKPP